MLEREMEDLIAANPDHFFPRLGFVLKGRQQSFRGVGRFDLLFVDRHGMTILMELKAVPARYEVIDQVARYRDALVAQGSTNILMWIVAPTIPPGMKDFLSHLGIEYTEIHEAEFGRAATLFDYVLRGAETSVSNGKESLPAFDSSKQLSEHNALSETTQRFREATLTGTDEWGFGKGTQPSFLLRALESGGKTKQEIRSEYIAHFHPDLSYEEAKSKSGFGVFFSDSKRPLGTYHASRSLLVVEDEKGRLSLNEERTKIVKGAIAAGILHRLRGLHFQRDKDKFNQVVSSFGLPTEP
jgi:Endonuclease NucS